MSYLNSHLNGPLPIKEEVGLPYWASINGPTGLLTSTSKYMVFKFREKKLRAPLAKFILIFDKDILEIDKLLDFISKTNISNIFENKFISPFKFYTLLKCLVI